MHQSDGRTVEHVQTADGQPVLEVVEPRGLRIRKVIARLGGLLIVLLIVLMLWTLIEEVRSGRDDARGAREEAQAAREEAQRVRGDLVAAQADRDTLLDTVERQATQLDALTQQLLDSGVDPADLGVPEVPTNGGSGPAADDPAGGSGGTDGGGGGSPPSPGAPGPAGPSGPPGAPAPTSPPPPAPPLPEPCLLRSPLTGACLIPLP